MIAPRRRRRWWRWIADYVPISSGLPDSRSSFEESPPDRGEHRYGRSALPFALSWFALPALALVLLAYLQRGR